MSSEYEAVVDSQYPGDLRLIGSLTNPLLKISGKSYSKSVQSTGIVLEIVESFRYPIQPLDGSLGLDGNIYLSGYRQPRLP